MKKVAIISFFHPEASICLAKYVAKQNVFVDFYYITDYIRDKGYVPGFEYRKVKRKIGICKLNKNVIPEIYDYTNNLPISFYLLRILSFSKKIAFINKIIIRKSAQNIKSKQYNAINIIGQHPWVKYIHQALLGENIIHTFHEIGSHQDGKITTELVNMVIQNNSKVILPSCSTYQRYVSIEGSNKVFSHIIPIGKFETIPLYDKNTNLSLPLNLSIPTFLFYGYIKPYKGLDLLAKVHYFLKELHKDFNIIIAGDGYDENLEYFKKQNNCYVINRFLKNEEMIYLNRISTSIILPYKTASQSGIVVNSFLFGKPIIATKVGALGEYIKNGYNGLLVEPNNPEEFANAIKRIVNNPHLLKELEQGAMCFGVDDEYNWSYIAQKTIDVYFDNYE